MNIGNLTQKASRTLSIFVVMCTIVITGLLYILQKSEALGSNLAPSTSIYEAE